MKSKEFIVYIDGNEAYRVHTLKEVAEALTAHYSCPYVKFTRNIVYNIRAGRCGDKHGHIQILPPCRS